MRAGEDNLDTPSATIPATERAGWAAPGWWALTLGEIGPALPWDLTLGAVAVRFLVARTAGRIERAD